MLYWFGTRLSEKIFVSNWTPLDMASLPRFRFLDITLYPAYWPTFTRKTELTNKNWQRHNQEYQNASLSWCILMHPVAPHCIPGHSEWVSSRSGCLSSPSVQFLFAFYAVRSWFELYFLTILVCFAHKLLKTNDVACVWMLMHQIESLCSYANALKVTWLSCAPFIHWIVFELNVFTYLFNISLFTLINCIDNRWVSAPVALRLEQPFKSFWLNTAKNRKRGESNRGLLGKIAAFMFKNNSKLILHFYWNQWRCMV